MSKMTIFLSYVEDEAGRAAASSLREALAPAHIDAIMAPERLRVGDDWQRRIREFLEESAALVVIGTAGIIESAWCQQEIGWALGRHVPVVWIKYDGADEPCGFLARYQALEAVEPSRDADSVTDWLCRQEGARALVVDAWIGALEDSDSFRASEATARLLARLETVTAQQWARISAASDTNNQVGQAHVRVPYSKSWPTVIGWLATKLEVEGD